MGGYWGSETRPSVVMPHTRGNGTAAKVLLFRERVVFVHRGKLGTRFGGVGADNGG